MKIYVVKDKYQSGHPKPIYRAYGDNGCNASSMESNADAVRILKEDKYVARGTPRGIQEFIKKYEYELEEYEE